MYSNQFFYNWFVIRQSSFLFVNKQIYYELFNFLLALIETDQLSRHFEKVSRKLDFTKINNKKNNKVNLIKKVSSQ